MSKSTKYMKYPLKFLKLSRYRPRIIYNFAKGMLLAKIFKKRILRGLDLAVTYRCPASCVKCSAKNLIDPSRAELTIDEILRIMNESIEMGAVHVNLTGGEAVLRNDIIDIIKRLREKPLIISLGSCAYTLTDELLEKLKDAGLGAIQISLDSPFENEHDTEVGIKGSYKKALAAIKKSRELDMEVLINTVVTHEKLHSDRIEKLVNIAKENTCFLCFILPAELGGWEGQNRALDQGDFAMIKQWLKNPHTTNELETCYSRGLCPAGSEKIYISAYGDLYPCPLIHKKHGNVLNEGLAHLWRKMSGEMGKSQCEGCLNVKTLYKQGTI